MKDVFVDFEVYGNDGNFSIAVNSEEVKLPEYTIAQLIEFNQLIPLESYSLESISDELLKDA